MNSTSTLTWLLLVLVVLLGCLGEGKFFFGTQFNASKVPENIDFPVNDSDVVRKCYDFHSFLICKIKTSSSDERNLLIISVNR